MLFNKLFLFLLAGLLAGSVFGQQTSGVITFEYRVDNHRSIPPEREELKAMIPQYRTENYTLVFTAEERSYMPVDEPVSPGGHGGGPGGGRGRGFRMPQLEAYTNPAEGIWLGFQEFFGKPYIITDTVALQPWRLGNELMDIAGYRCQMAWTVDTITKEEITAWFTFSLQPFMGPDRFVTLPGTILAVDINNGEKVWVARSVEFRPVEPAEIERPTRGERITPQEYKRITDEQMERMRSRF